MDTRVVQVRDLIKKAENCGYQQALTDLMQECRLKKADGFVMSDDLLTEIIEMLIEKNNKFAQVDEVKTQKQEEDGAECVRCGEWCGYKLVGDERALYCPNCN